MLVRAMAAPSPTLPAAKGQTAEDAGQEKAIRPETDWWSAGGTRYESTSDLLVGATIPAEGLQASYSFQRDIDKLDTRIDRILGGAAVGAVGGLVLGGGMTLIAGVVSILEQMAFYGSSSMPVAGLLLVPTIAGAAVGALAGNSEPGDPTQMLGGTIRREVQADGSSKTFFYKGDNLNQKVDLEEYAQAELPTPPKVEDVPLWKDSLMGAGAGAAASAETFTRE